jgi:hypothetical protein
LGVYGIWHLENLFVVDPVFTTVLSRDLNLIQTHYRSSANTNGTDADDVIDVYLVPPYSHTSRDGQVYGNAASSRFVSEYPPGDPVVTLPPSYANQVFVNLSAASESPAVLAHEILHILTNENDADAPRHILFPFNRLGLNYGSTPATFRRLQEATVTKARTERAAGSMAATGNRLLRNP